MKQAIASPKAKESAKIAPKTTILGFSKKCKIFLHNLAIL
jgi:hypothetical protein